MESALTTVYISSNIASAEVIKAALEGAGIQAVIENEHQAAMTGVIDVKVQVRAEDAERATQFIEEHEQGEGFHQAE